MFCVNRMKRQATDWEETLANHIPDPKKKRKSTSRFSKYNSKITYLKTWTRASNMA